MRRVEVRRANGAAMEGEFVARRVLVLGAGFAGLWTAIAAARRRAELGLTPDDLEIVTVARAPFHDIRVRNYESDLAGCRLALGPMLAAVDVGLQVGDVQSIDIDAARVQIAESGTVIEYDRLVIALGSLLVRPGIPGLDLHGFDIDTYDAASRLNAHLGRLPAAPSTAGSATVVVVGAGLTGIEAATEMTTRLATVWSGSPVHPRVLLVDHNPRVGSDMGESAHAVIASALDALGIETRTAVRVVEVRADAVVLDSGERIAAATVVWCAGMRASPLVEQLPVPHDRLGRVTVDEYLRVPELPGVFAAGDVACAPVDGDHVSVMSCQHSRPMGRFAGRNVVDDLVGGELMALRIPWYVTVLDLGAAGAVHTEGWDRRVVATGATAKTTKRIINTQRIYPRPGADRDALLDAAAPVVQMPPAYGTAVPTH